MPRLKRIGVRCSRAFLLRAHGCLWLCPVELGAKRRGFLGTRWSWCSPDIEEPPGHEEGSVQNGQMAKSCSFMVVGKNLV
jgi:hypothetical protein